MKKNFLRIAFAAALFVLSTTGMSNPKLLSETGGAPMPTVPPGSPGPTGSQGM